MYGMPERDIRQIVSMSNRVDSLENANSVEMRSELFCNDRFFGKNQGNFIYMG